MATLRIEHAIADFDQWHAAFERFGAMRTRAGVRAQRIHQPAGDSHYIFIDLDFDAVEQARDFLTFLKTKVWTSAENAPALVGTPRTTILRPATAG